MPSTPLSSTPLSTLLLLLLSTLSLLTSLTSHQHLLPLRPLPTLYPHLRLHTLLTHQLIPSTSPTLLFHLLLLYHLRTLERSLGTRKYTSLLLTSLFCNAVLSTLLLILALQPLSRGTWNHIPAGPIGVVLAALAVWSAEVPQLWKWEMVLSKGGRGRGGSENKDLRAWTLTLSDQSPIHLLALQLALTDFPFSLLPASVGYLIGTAWVAEVLPWGMSGWRVPGWVVGQGQLRVSVLEWGLGSRGRGSANASARTTAATAAAAAAAGDHNHSTIETNRERYEGLRRRLEEEGGRGGDGDGMRRVAHAHAEAGTSMDPGAGAGGGMITATTRRRSMGAQIADYFRGVF